MGLKIFYSGLILGRLTLIKEEKIGSKNFWHVKCQCGNEQIFRTDYISQLKCTGKKFECSECKRSRRFLNLTNSVYGRLTVIKEVPSITKDRMWLVQCECGIKKEIKTHALTRKSKPTRSCGCLARKLHSKWVNTTQYPPAHKLRTKRTEETKASLYHIRNNLVSACYCESDPRYQKHGKYGHTVCDLWRNGAKDFVNWALKKGYKKNEGFGVYLKRNKTEFNPNNCFIQKKSDFASENNSILVTYKNETKNISQWASELNCTTSCLSQRLKKYKKYGLDKIFDLSWVAEKNQLYGTEHLENDCISLYQKGLSYKEICDKLDCSASTVKRFLKKNNISPRVAACRSAQTIKNKMNEVNDLKNSGKNLSEISKILGLPYSTMLFHYRNFKKSSSSFLKVDKEV
jgi:predicted transcriptional regulator